MTFRSTRLLPTAALLALLIASTAAHAQPPAAPSVPAPASADTPAIASPPKLPKGIVADAAAAQKIASGHRFTEGPVWIDAPEGGYLLFSDIPQDAIFRWTDGDTAELWLKPSGFANGLIAGPGGSVLAATHAGRIDVLKPEQPARTLAATYNDKALNSPNDICVGPRGDLLFTDPPYGTRPPLGPAGRSRELDFAGIYALSADGKVTLLNKDLKTPNGLALSPDGQTLYVADTSTGTITAFALQPDGSLTNKRLFATTKDPGTGKPAGADGLKVDIKGNVYCAARGGVHVFDPNGAPLGLIPIDRNVTNLCFGGPDRTWLFATTGPSVYRIKTLIPGLKPPEPKLPARPVPASQSPDPKP